MTLYEKVAAEVGAANVVRLVWPRGITSPEVAIDKIWPFINVSLQAEGKVPPMLALLAGTDLLMVNADVFFANVLAIMRFMKLINDSADIACLIFIGMARLSPSDRSEPTFCTKTSPDKSSADCALCANAVYCLAALRDGKSATRVARIRHIADASYDLEVLHDFSGDEIIPDVLAKLFQVFRQGPAPVPEAGLLEAKMNLYEKIITEVGDDNVICFPAPSQIDSPRGFIDLLWTIAMGQIARYGLLSPTIGLLIDDDIALVNASLFLSSEKRLRRLMKNVSDEPSVRGLAIIAEADVVRVRKDDTEAVEKLRSQESIKDHPDRKHVIQAFSEFLDGRRAARSAEVRLDDDGRIRDVLQPTDSGDSFEVMQSPFDLDTH